MTHFLTRLGLTPQGRLVAGQYNTATFQRGLFRFVAARAVARPFGCTQDGSTSTKYFQQSKGLGFQHSGTAPLQQCRQYVQGTFFQPCTGCGLFRRLVVVPSNADEQGGDGVFQRFREIGQGCQRKAMVQLLKNLFAKRA